MSSPTKNHNQKSLGRGLSSLIGQDSKSRQESVPVEVPYFPKTRQGVSNQILPIQIEKIKANPHQPRKDFNEISMNDLVASIKEHGILQPLTVTQTMGGDYELIAGERRLRAAKIAGFKQVPVIVRTAKELEKLELSLIENIQRQDLNPIEKAESYQKLTEEFSLTHEEAAKRLGISRAQFSNMIRLLSLPNNIQQGLASGKISLGQAKVLLEIKDNKQLEQIYKHTAQAGLTVEDTKREVKKVKVKSHIRQIKKEPQIKEWENKMQEKLNTRVSIRKRGQNGGVIEIEYYSEEELRALISNILSY